MQTKHTPIIAIDGNVYTGKTSIARTAGGIYIPEHNDFPINLQNDPRQTQKAYLKIDSIRRQCIISGRIHYLDRSFVSLCAHVWALYKSGTDIREQFLSDLINSINAGEQIIPAAYIFVRCSYETALRRYQKNEREHPKGTAPQLIAREYFESVNEWNLLWQENITAPTTTIDTECLIDKIKVREILKGSSAEIEDPRSALCTLLAPQLAKFLEDYGTNF